MMTKSKACEHDRRRMQTFALAHARDFFLTGVVFTVRSGIFFVSKHVAHAARPAIALCVSAISRWHAPCKISRKTPISAATGTSTVDMQSALRGKPTPSRATDLLREGDRKTGSTGEMEGRS